MLSHYDPAAVKLNNVFYDYVYAALPSYLRSDEVKAYNLELPGVV